MIIDVLKFVVFLSFCHVSNSEENDDRIVGGDLAKQGQFPYQVRMLFFYLDFIYILVGTRCRHGFN